MTDHVSSLMSAVKAKNPAEPEFHQAVQEVAESLTLVLDRHPEYRHARILERLVEPERVLMFRVPWLDDQGQVQINRGFRIEMNSAIGPYKGGLRFHPSVNLGILKFLAFEQVFKNSLTTLPMGGGKGGSDFDPKGKSDNEVMRFCQSFMTELYRHIGPNTDVPAGDIGVGGREIGYLFGQYKRLRNEFTGVLTGKGLNWGGSLIRPEATGYGCVYFAAEMLEHARRDRSRARRAWSRAAATSPSTRSRSCSSSARRPVTLSDSDRLHLRRGRHRSREARVRDGAEERAPRPHQGVRGQVQGRGLHRRSTPAPDTTRSGTTRRDCAFPSATQNEINGKDAANLLQERRLRRGARARTCRRRSTASTSSWTRGILYGPGKAANAGGVATSGLEMAQNSMRYSWTREEVDARLRLIMKHIHQACVETAERFGTPGNYVNGANIAGFLKVADSMMDQGVV